MVLGKRNLIIAGVAAAVLVVGGAAFVANQKPHDGAQSADAGQRGAGGPGGPGAGPGGGQRGPGGPGGAGGPGGRGGGKPTDVGAVPATSKEFSSRIEPLGTLEPRERVVLSANAADRVTGVFFEDGQRVAKGKTLMTLAAEQEQSELASSQATLANAKLVYERNQRLSSGQAIAELEMERAKATYEAAAANVAAIQARLRDRVLVAPFTGVLGFRQVSVGAYVSPGQAVATLIDDSQMRMEFGVPSIEINNLKVGLPVEATTADIPGRTFTGTLTSIDNAVDPVTLSVKVRATLPNRDGALRAGTSMKVALKSKSRTSLSIPEIAVIAEGSKNFVYVVDNTRQPAVAAKTEVQLGTRERGIVEVVSGLETGQMVVTDGVLKLRPGLPVRVKAPSIEGEGEPRVAGGGAAEGPTDRAGRLGQ
ncbi:MAG TPA: efflux RND transporter periplasmic adaptor subunit [Hyphomonadaceae bacterium]|jgi:membrane fusion protein (multidrug efflux system)|nr:efflux RND transporter periplasmic adaptor subunit [Hyphomonadaceae bacterium]